jgi:hypothetical protein
VTKQPNIIPYSSSQDEFFSQDHHEEEDGEGEEEGETTEDFEYVSLPK